METHSSTKLAKTFAGAKILFFCNYASSYPAKSASYNNEIPTSGFGAGVIPKCEFELPGLFLFFPFYYI